ncbi:hypothetical protein MRX96_055917 [Rhipicephalus microplus]
MALRLDSSSVVSYRSCSVVTGEWGKDEAPHLRTQAAASVRFCDEHLSFLGSSMLRTPLKATCYLRRTSETTSACQLVGKESLKVQVWKEKKARILSDMW